MSTNLGSVGWSTGQRPPLGPSDGQHPTLRWSTSDTRKARRKSLVDGKTTCKAVYPLSSPSSIPSTFDRLLLLRFVAWSLKVVNGPPIFFFNFLLLLFPSLEISLSDCSKSD